MKREVVNLRLDRYPKDSLTRIINVRRALTGPIVNPERNDVLPTFVVHLMVQACDVDAAARLARHLCAALAHVRELDAGLTAVSPEGDILHPQRVFCDNRIASGRCALPPGHPEPCGERA